MIRDTEREALSAYLDGETSDPEVIQRLLEDDPEAAAYIEALQHVSNRVQALPRPDVHPAFLTRVMARVAEEQRDVRRSRWPFRVATCLAGAALLLLVGGLAYFHNPGDPSLNGIQVADVPVNNVLVISEIEGYDVQDDIVTEDSYAIDPWSDPVFLDEELELLDAIDAMLFASQDLGSAVATLDEAETEVFYELLDLYMTGEYTT